MKISEIFKSIQGEGRYAGVPMLFIRTSGCTRNCEWCDTKYHTKGKKMSIDDLVNIIKRLPEKEIVCFTGGEPLLQKKEIRKIIESLPSRIFHIETNGDLLDEIDLDYFNYLGISPKDKKTAKMVLEKIKERTINNDILYDIKIVTDLEKIGIDMFDYATMLMPLSLEDKEKSKEIAQKVWNYCVDNDIIFGQRLHTYIFNLNDREV